MIALIGFISRQKRRRVCPRIARTGANEKAKAYLIDDYAEGKDTGIIDLVLVGNIDQYHLSDLSRKTERYIQRKIRTLVLSRDEFAEFEPQKGECSSTIYLKKTFGLLLLARIQSFILVKENTKSSVTQNSVGRDIR